MCLRKHKHPTLLKKPKNQQINLSISSDFYSPIDVSEGEEETEEGVYYPIEELETHVS